MVLKKVALDILYQPFDKKPYRVIVHPYLLKEFSNRWYVFGKNHKTGLIERFGLDRIISFEVSHHDFIEDPSFDPNDFFKDVIGVTVPVNGNPIKIILSFNREQGNYAKTKPLHHSQKILKDTRDELQVELMLIPNYELKKLLWSFGDTVKVLEPKNLFQLCK